MSNPSQAKPCSCLACGVNLLLQRRWIALDKATRAAMREDGYGPHAGRGLCGACYTRHQKAGTLSAFTPTGPASEYALRLRVKAASGAHPRRRTQRAIPDRGLCGGPCGRLLVSLAAWKRLSPTERFALAPTHAAIMGRGLCRRCYLQARTAGKLADYDRTTSPTELTFNRWKELHAQGCTRTEAAKMMGISPAALGKAIKKFEN